MNHQIRDAADKRYEELSRQFKRLAEERRESEPIILSRDYSFGTVAGPIQLSACFEGKRDLILIHNMGVGCSWCTMWADAFNGVEAHLRDRAGLILLSPDTPEVIEGFARARGWRFQVASAKGSGFTDALDFGTDEQPWPGFSTFYKNDKDEIEWISAECFGDFDLFSPVWHMIGRLKHGVGDWEPEINYPSGHTRP